MQHKYSKDDVTIVNDQIAYSGYFKIRKLKFHFTQFNGQQSETVDRELFERGHAVGMLLYDVSTDQVVLLEQFRAGAIDDSVTPWMYELVAGVIEEGESTEQVAYRECVEEAGCEPDKLLPMFKLYLTPGGSTETMQFYCGRIDASKVGGVYGLAEEGEDIMLHVVDREQALQMVSDGQIKNAPAVIAIQWLALNLERVRAEFS